MGKKTIPYRKWERTIRQVCIALILFSGYKGWAIGQDVSSIHIFAAASTTNVVTDICQLFSETYGTKALPSFASSSTLAKQIENGAPSDIYISANSDWMDYLEKKDLIVGNSRFDLAKNRLVLIVPQKSSINKIDINPSMDLKPIIGDGFLSMGDPDHVPAGMYAKDALEKLGLYKELEIKIARLNTVRAALAMVERNESSLGIVYATDAAMTDQVKAVGIFPIDSHPPIVYPAAIIKGHDTDNVKRFLQFLKTPVSKSIFEKYGFTHNE
ncbi:MAG: molybdate ABC transporter substrate-binding protein [Proteobacteria bacterium]|nr:molybdate ABC transporter substrate-binding protein [Pseudomonadota bacterium]